VFDDGTGKLTTPTAASALCTVGTAYDGDWPTAPVGFTWSGYTDGTASDGEFEYNLACNDTGTVSIKCNEYGCADSGGAC
jgi:hypothetical protein